MLIDRDYPSQWARSLGVGKFGMSAKTLCS